MPTGMEVLSDVGNTRLADDRPLVSVPGVAGNRRARHARPTRVRRMSVFVDVVMLLGASVLIPAFKGQTTEIWSVVMFDLVAVGLLMTWHSYNWRVRLDVLDDIRLVTASTAVAAMTTISFQAVFAPPANTNGLIYLWLVSGALLSLGRIGTTEVTLKRRRAGVGSATALIVGAGRVGQLAARRLLEHPEFGLKPVGFLDKEPVDIAGEPLPLPVLGASWDLETLVTQYDVECVLLTFSTAPHDVFLDLADRCERLGLRVMTVPRLFERVPSRVSVEHVGGLPLLETHPTSPKNVQYAIKAILDRVTASVLLILLSPILLMVALAVRISLGSPILYRQERVGLDGKPFEMLKFRTMRPHFDPSESVEEFDPRRAPGGIEGADRRTRVGSLLRATSLDELAQLVNVLKGEMSIVGPRPERPEYVEYFTSRVHRYDARHRVKGGITGWAQIHRLRGKTSIADRIEWDNYYIENFSLWLDLKILLLTIPAIVGFRSE
jgi:exopolysaccharide biosynthesis polyprenyl glycosylphosphotransferase